MTNDRAEVNGPIALNDQPHTTSDAAPTATLITEPETTRTVGRPFQKGVSGNPHGRPRKGETLAEKLARADERVATRAIRARDKRLTALTQVGNRAWENYLAYRVGLPKQPFVHELADSPLAALLTDLAALRQPAGDIIDGESRLLEASSETDITT